MKDVKLIIYGIVERFDSEIIQMEELPKVGEYISTIYFQNRHSEFEYTKVFRVSRIVHHYLDDMSSVDYSEIELERPL